MRDEIKEFLIDLALMTRDFDWAKEIKSMNFEMSPQNKDEDLEKEILSSINLNHTTDSLAAIWNTLNCFKWDSRLGDKPKNYDDLPDFKPHIKKGTKREYISPIMIEIEKIIGKKECLRWHHTHNLNRTIDEFEKWWTVNGNIGI